MPKNKVVSKQLQRTYQKSRTVNYIKVNCMFTAV